MGGIPDIPPIPKPLSTKAFPKKMGGMEFFRAKLQTIIEQQPQGWRERISIPTSSKLVASLSRPDHQSLKGAKVPSPIAPSLKNTWRFFPVKSCSFLNTWHFLIKVQKYLAVSGLLSIFYDKLTFIYLEMPKFNKTEDELLTMFDKWIFAQLFLKVVWIVELSGINSRTFWN